MSQNRMKYDEEFKKRAVRMSYSSERSVTAVAESLGVTSNMIYRWRKKYTPEGDKTQLAEQQDAAYQSMQVSSGKHRQAYQYQQQNLLTLVLYFCP